MVLWETMLTMLIFSKAMILCLHQTTAQLPGYKLSQRNRLTVDK